MSIFDKKIGGLIGVAATINANTASGMWTLRQQQLNYQNWPIIPVEVTGPPVSGYTAWYTADSVSGTSWTDLSGNGYTATIGGSGYSVVSTTGNGATGTFNVLQGTTSSTITWPSGILPSTYTFFHVARYNGTERRIFTGSTNNWLSGFWNGNAGVAFHEGWITAQTDLHGTNWVYSTDQNSLYRSNGTTRGTSGGSASSGLRLNTGNVFGETSDFQIAELIVYSSTLSQANYESVESYLKTKYGL